MNQELQDSVRFSDLAYTIKAILSHKITISNVLLARSGSEHCRYKQTTPHYNLTILHVIEPFSNRKDHRFVRYCPTKNGASEKSQFWQKSSKLCNRTLAALQKRATRSACDGERENYNQISLLLLVQTNQRVLDSVLTSTQVRFTAGRMAREKLRISMAHV